jgi:hypothetical protein
MRKTTIYLFLFTLLSPLHLPATLILPNGPPWLTAIDWDGINQYDGDGTSTFTSGGQVITATLKILCNKNQGYSVIFYSPNATGTTASVLKNGSNTLSYTASMNSSGILNANITRSSLSINQISRHSLRVSFTGSGRVKPMNGNTQANVVVFSLTLQSITGLITAGTYSDIIYASISLN